MSETSKDGGPAFPSDYGGRKVISVDGVDSHVFGGSPGMSLRAWYAGHALGPLLHSMRTESDAAISRAAFAVADEMLTAGGHGHE